MSDDGIQLDIDESPEPAAPKAKKDSSGVVMVTFTIIAFLCLVGALSLQVLEFLYFRGTDNPNDRFAAEVLLPPKA